jgi:hypothetical protein
VNAIVNANANKHEADRLVADLLRLMREQVGLHGEMADQMNHKLEAVRRADTAQIQAITARETELLRRATEREGLRRQLTRRIVAALGLDAESNHRIRLEALAKHFGEPARELLLIETGRLKAKLHEIEQIRVTTTLVTQEMIKHLNEVLAVMTSGVHGEDIYSRTGGKQDSTTANVFEAVG